MTHSRITREMISHIADFFRFMSENKEYRLYYTLPLQIGLPYAFQHSSIRDIATIDDILVLIEYFNKQGISLTTDTLLIFEKVIKNTLEAYHKLYENGRFSDLPDGNIGDMGFFLLTLSHASNILPNAMPNHWKKTKIRLINYLIQQQNPDGSLTIFFDNDLKKYEKSSEAFYLPEALIGLIESFGDNQKEIDEKVALTVQKAVLYCCQDANRERNLESETSTFYTNWQFQMLYHWIHKGIHSESALVKNHVNKLLDFLKTSYISKHPFESQIATVEVACYLEGLIHAREILKMLKIPTITYDAWLENEIDRSVQFLYAVQMKHMDTLKGGFAHSLNSHEARIDVAGHVFNGLCLI